MENLQKYFDSARSTRIIAFQLYKIDPKKWGSYYLECRQAQKIALNNLLNYKN